MELKEYTAGGYLPASFLDWEGKITAVVFTSKCDFRCPWCHNSGLVNDTEGHIPLDKVIADITRRKDFLDGVVVSGGEPCIWNGLFPLLHALKDTGLAVKLDTNGSVPEAVERAIDEKLVAHIAMDVKAPLDADIMSVVVGVPAPLDNIKKSIAILKNFAPSYEFRTTFMPALLSIEDLAGIRAQLNDDEHWFIQCFKPVNCLDTEFQNMTAVDPEDIRKLFPDIKVRG